MAGQAAEAIINAPSKDDAIEFQKPKALGIFSIVQG
jgi:hypothetical protein